MKPFKIKTAVIGTGSMGRNHARILSEVSDLVGIYDMDRKIAKEVADRYSVESYPDIEELIKRSGAQAVSIATPTTHHAKSSITCLRSGIHVLVEKPIAEDRSSAEKMIEEARKAGVVLSVGMVERHNPIVKFTKEMIEKGIIGQIVTIGTKRLSTLPPRIKDVGVITDIGVHDMDVMRYISGSEARTVYALGGKVKTDNFEDHATFLVRFANGIEGVGEVSWLSPMKVRKMTISGSNAIAEMDYIDQELLVSSSTFGVIDPNNLWKIPQKYDIRRMRVQNEEPLRREIWDFLESVRDGKEPLVGGNDGLKALLIAKAAELSIETGKVVTVEDQ